MKIKRILAMAVILLAAYILQYGVFPLCPWIDTVPNLLLIVAVSFGYFLGEPRPRRIESRLIDDFCISHFAVGKGALRQWFGNHRLGWE